MEAVIRILYVEDNPGDVKLLQYEFAETAPSIEIDWAATYGEAVEKLSRYTPENQYYDLVLTDMNLPDGKGISLLSTLREHRLPVPLIVITGLGDEDSAVSALKAGAIDYMVKNDTYLKYLPSTIETAVQKYKSERTRQSKPIRVLYCEQDNNDIKLTKRHFSVYAPFIIFDSVNTANDLLQNLAKPEKNESPERNYDVLLIDYQLPDMSAIDLLKELRQVQQHDIPIVITSSEGNQEIAVQALRIGANDYIAKNPGYLYRLPNVLENVFNRTQLEREQAALKASEEHFRTLIENSSDLILVFDSESITRYCSPSLERILGYKPVEMMGVDPIDYIHPKDMPQLNKRLSQILTTSNLTFGPIVLRARHKNGSWRYMEVFGKRTEIKPGNNSVIINSRDITERKEAEEALRRSEENYRILAKNANDMIWIMEISESGINITYLSPSVKRLIGYTPEEGKMLPIEILHTPASAFKVRENIKKVIESAKSGKRGEPDRLELEYICKNGSIIWVESISSGFFDDTGRFKGILGVSRDITKRKQAEVALLTSQIHLSEAMELARVVYWEADFKDDMFIFNDPYYSFLKTSAKAEGGYRMALKDYVERFIPPEDAHIVFQLIKQMSESDSSNQFEHRIIRRDGEMRHIVIKTMVIKDDSGSISHIFGTNQDITERKKMEVALQESELKYRGLVENSLVGVFILQNDFFQFVNKRFCEIHGYTYEEIIDKVKPLKFIYNEDHEMVDDGFKNVAVAGSMELDFRLVRKDGKIINTKAFISLISYMGRPAIAGTMIDTTRERTLENQLRQSQKMEAIGTLAGGIAHDFNNILTVLTGYGTLLKMEKEGSLQTTYIDAILSASQKATNLTKSLLAFARQQPITLAPVNINEVVKGTEKLLKRLLTEDIALKTNLSSEEIYVLADAVQIDQILFNLAVNARDAMPNGGNLTLETKMITVDRKFADVHGLEESGNYAVLSISDTGVGMDENTREHIFEPFYTTKEVGKGTGLGLSTVYGIVKQHNGYISVYSEKNIGTIFNIYLRITNVKSIKETDLPLLKGGAETILLAEDSKDVRNLMRKILVEYGYSVIEAADGDEAIELFNTHGETALLILDSVMPKKNGRQVFDEISAISPYIKVIFISGYTRDVVLKKGIEDKKFDFIAKPVPPDVLIKKVREVLDR